MEQLVTYLLKSSGLIAVFFLAYHFLVRKDTFFNSNRWFLLGGLVTSLLLPLYFIKKITLVEKPRIPIQDFVIPAQPTHSAAPVKPVVEAFDWIQLVWMVYFIVAAVLLVKIVLNLISLYRMLHQHLVIKNESFKLVNLKDNLAPFSFFNYIAYNPELYSDDELRNILLHEKTHSREKHSIDVLFTEILCALFWFNPFIWLYKKAITQNLEYIADQKAIDQSDNKKSYQHALLKVVSNQNCLPITNNFYQSLIKKRIVMLNKNQSHRTNYLKYAVVIPVITGFIFLFQVKVIAREKFTPEIITEASNPSIPKAASVAIPEEAAVIESINNPGYIIDKISSDAEIKSTCDEIKTDFNIDVKVSNVKRNSKNEITCIKINYNDNKGNKGKTEQIREHCNPADLY
ncbi:MAG: M56 family metallopeptidase [Flavobacterium sp.]